MPQEPKRIILPREAEPDSGASWIGAAIFCAVTVCVFIGVLLSVLRSRRPDYLVLLPVAVLAGAGVVGMVLKLRSSSSRETFGAVPLELDAPGLAEGKHWRATVRLPRSASAAATVHAEILCWKKSFAGREQQSELLWGKGSSFGIRWVYGDGSAALVFEIPPGLPHSGKFDSTTREGHTWGEWELKVTAGDLERNYDLDIQPAAGPPYAPDAAPAAESAEVLIARAAAAPEDKLPGLPPDYTSAVVLVAANLVLVAGVLVWGWRVQDVVFLYWIENLVIGFYHVPRMLVAVPKQMGWMTRQGIAPSGSELFFGKLFYAAFFALHFGFFCYIHGEFLSVFILWDDHVMGANLLWPLLRKTLHDPHALAAIAAIAVSHGYSFLRNYLGRGEYQRVDLEKMMMQPYRRVVVMHVFLLAGTFALIALGSPPSWLVAVFVAFKIAVDVYYHRSERKALSTDSPPAR